MDDRTRARLKTLVTHRLEELKQEAEELRDLVTLLENGTDELQKKRKHWTQTPRGRNHMRRMAEVRYAKEGKRTRKPFTDKARKNISKGIRAYWEKKRAEEKA